MTAFNVVRFRVKPGNEQVFGGGLGITDPVSGEVVARLGATRVAKKPRAARTAKKKATKKGKARS